MAVSDTQCRLTLESHQQIYQAPLLDTSAVAYFILLSLRLVAACNVQRGVEGPRQSIACVRFLLTSMWVCTEGNMVLSRSLCHQWQCLLSRLSL